MDVNLTPEDRAEFCEALNHISQATSARTAFDWATILPVIMKIVAAILAALIPPSPPNPPGRT